MGDYPLYRGWDVIGRLMRGFKRSFSQHGLSAEASGVDQLARSVSRKLTQKSLDEPSGQMFLAKEMASHILVELGADTEEVSGLSIHDHLSSVIFDLIGYERLFDIPTGVKAGNHPTRSDIWEAEDHIRKTDKILNDLDTAMGDLVGLIKAIIKPIVAQHPRMFQPIDVLSDELSFETILSENLIDLPKIIEAMVQVPFAPELEDFGTTANLKERLEYNLIVASGGIPGKPDTHPRTPKLPTKASPMLPAQLIETYLEGTPLARLFDLTVHITIPTETRFEHHHIVAGSGHGKTQTLQHLILHDLDKVAAGEASIVVIDSQSDLINNIAGLKVFAPGGSLADRLVHIDPTDVEWPVALNLFDVGMDRINQYSQLDRERLINGILELYDFVLGTLLDAGMTQKQSVIFRYLTRLLLHIPNATIHTFRELLEDEGYLKYKRYIDLLSGSARAFFETEYQGREFTQTRKQVLRRLYGILENQSFERMFSHPKSKLDLFSEMNAGKVILINTAKDLLKENGTEIFGRFFIAMITQVAQERAVLPTHKRLPTFIYIDEANDYFDRNIGIILSQARKYRIGMILAHQFLGQLDNKLQEAIFANTAIKFAGGISAKDARALAGELRTDPSFIEDQEKLSFTAHIKGSTKQAVSLSIQAGEMEQLPRLTSDEKRAQLDQMRSRYAVHYTEVEPGHPNIEETSSGEDEPDTGEPMVWE